MPRSGWRARAVQPPAGTALRAHPNADVRELEAEIDRAVNRLYGLAEEPTDAEEPAPLSAVA